MRVPQGAHPPARPSPRHVLAHAPVTRRGHPRGRDARCENTAPQARVDGGDARVVAFINKRSGGQRGEAAHAALVEAIGADNVFTLVPKEGGPRPGLEELARAHYDNKGAGDGVVVLCCGGDGTFNWISTVLLDLEAIKPAGAPAFARSS